ncbi:YtxH domain-containing protein [Mammaliicoccus lentus]|uniref:YtxH domain-containing protein n=1 Tax=Mammaliicoccus lentus TaxID=42858 RepID=UPI002A59C2E1|nr:YtxH domain-containing protein [Mammaliicoccus lentus]WQL56971.1 YtxH domain-containing protein [Mammaliicoccus lentus]
MENQYNRDLYTHGLETYEAKHENNTSGRDFVFGVILGTVVGGIAGLLLAPKSGRALQDDLSEQSNKIIEDVKTKTDDLKAQAQTKAEELRTQAEEKKEEAADKAEQAKAKAEEKKTETKKKADEVKSKQAEKKANKNVVTADDVDDEELKAQKGAIKSEVNDEDLKGPKTVVEKKTFDKK